MSGLGVIGKDYKTNCLPKDIKFIQKCRRSGPFKDSFQRQEPAKKTCWRFLGQP